MHNKTVYILHGTYHSFNSIRIEFGEWTNYTILFYMIVDQTTLTTKRKDVFQLHACAFAIAINHMSNMYIVLSLDRSSIEYENLSHEYACSVVLFYFVLVMLSFVNGFIWYVYSNTSALHRLLWIKSYDSPSTAQETREWRGARDPSHKSYDSLVKYLTMHHFITEMCIHVHIYATKWCIVGNGISALWDVTCVQYVFGVNQKCEAS